MKKFAKWVKEVWAEIWSGGVSLEAVQVVLESMQIV